MSRFAWNHRTFFGGLAGKLGVPHQAARSSHKYFSCAHFTAYKASCIAHLKIIQFPLKPLLYLVIQNVGLHWLALTGSRQFVVAAIQRSTTAQKAGKILLTHCNLCNASIEHCIGLAFKAQRSPATLNLQSYPARAQLNDFPSWPGTAQLKDLSLMLDIVLASWRCHLAALLTSIHST